MIKRAIVFPILAQTQRAVDNFHISGPRMPAAFIRALGLVKSCAAGVNAELGLIDSAVAKAVCSVADKIAAGEHYEQYPLDVFQTGSGTSTNMNANVENGVRERFLLIFAHLDRPRSTR